MKYLLLTSILLLGCAASTPEDPFEIYQYEGFSAYSANSGTINLSNPTPKSSPDVGAAPIVKPEQEPKVRKRVYFITAKWCGPCIIFHEKVLPTLPLKSGRSWDDDILEINYDANIQWLRDRGFKPDGMTLPAFFFETGGLPNNRDPKTKTIEHHGYLSKEEFMKYYGQD